MSQQVVFDAELISRYERDGPRYASYPTAAQFNMQFDAYEYRRAALLSNADPTVALSAYVHIPFRPRLGCRDSEPAHDPLHVEQYLHRLKKEIELQSQLFDARRRLRQLRFGGGTPTLLGLRQLKNLIEHLNRHFQLDTSLNHDNSIEIDPRTLNPETLPLLKALGFNRLSLRVPDFDPEVQRTLNPIQPPEQTFDAVRQARACGFDSIDFELIYGLPLQTVATFARTLEHVIHIRPNRVAVSSYPQVSSRLKPQGIEVYAPPSSRMRIQLLQLAVETLTAAGYIYLGLDHFALANDELVSAQRGGHLYRNCQGYSAYPDCDLIGLGVWGIGQLGDTYSQNTKQLDDYYLAIDNDMLPVECGVYLTVDDRTRREIIRRILCDGRLDYRLIEERYVLDFEDYFAEELRSLEPMARDELIVPFDGGFEVSPKGRLLLRTIAMVFDGYLKPAGIRRFSDAV